MQGFSKSVQGATGVQGVQGDTGMTGLGETGLIGVTGLMGPTGPMDLSVDKQTGVLIPMYVYPGNIYTNATYNGLIDIAKKYHKVPITVILNPGNGPGTVTDGNYTVAIKRLKGAGIAVVGYVHTSYATISLSTVKGDIDTWLSLYPEIDGIFVDETTADSDSGHLAYFTELTGYAHAANLFPVINNPGTAVTGPNFATADVTVVYESSSYPSEATLKGDWADGNASYDYSGRGVLVYNQSTFDRDGFQMIRRYAGMVYITDVNGWTDLTSYMDPMLRLLDNSVNPMFTSQWDDIVLAASSLGKGANAPDLTSILSSGGIQGLGFDGGTTTEELFGSFEMPHNYQEGSDLYLHIHWMPSDTNSGNVKWNFEYSMAALGSTFPAPTTIAVTDAADGTAWKHQVIEFPMISGTGVTIGDQIAFRLYRNPADAADTYASDAILLSIGIHYSIDTIGSAQKTTKN